MTLTDEQVEALANEAVTIVAQRTDGLFHLYDADPNLSLCGRDLTHVPHGPLPGEQPCVVCAELDEVLP